jgi:hypothetical protein
VTQRREDIVVPRTPSRLVNIAAPFLILFTVLSALPVLAQSVSVTTWHNDNSRTGRNVSETLLTTSNVKSTNFGKIFSYKVDGQIYAQPLYVPNLLIPGLGPFNVLFIATEHDSVYAFDADGRRSAPLWQVTFINGNQGITTVSTKNSPCKSIQPEVGITSTPVVDLSTNTLYVEAATSQSGLESQKLHALDITTGAEKFGGPTLIQATASSVDFDPTLIQRTGLLLANGVVYLGFASLCDPHPYHGWIIGYQAGTLQQTSAFVTTPNGDKGGIWQSGAGLAADGNNNIFVMDGDGTFDVTTGGIDYGMSLMKVRTAGGLHVLDYFAPWNQASLSNEDMDLGSGGVMLLPTQSGPHPNEAIAGDKEGKIFVVDQNNLGGFDPTKNNIVQTLKTSAKGYFSTAAYWQETVYYAGVNDSLCAYSVTNGLLSSSPISKTAFGFGSNGATPSISANNTKSGIVWLIKVQPGQAAILYAYDAKDLTNELYDSSQSGNRDKAGIGVKYSVPTIANGKVFVGTQTEVDVYGLLGQ